MKISLTTSKDIITVQEVKTKVSEITVLEMVDSPERKTVTLRTRELGSIVLWKGEDYDAIGQWTDADVEDKIRDLYE